MSQTQTADIGMDSFAAGAVGASNEFTSTRGLSCKEFAALSEQQFRREGQRALASQAWAVVHSTLSVKRPALLPPTQNQGR